MHTSHWFKYWVCIQYCIEAIAASQVKARGLLIRNELFMLIEVARSLGGSDDRTKPASSEHIGEKFETCRYAMNAVIDWIMF